ncbi:MAG TPA: cytochrome c oxidase subunit 3 [Gemmatimonadales bacterium]|nr:cytochrome c oxidase subunit 3 [Gemmatimonadales bacterium]
MTTIASRPPAPPPPPAPPAVPVATTTQPSGPSRAQTGVLVGIATITMSFAALTSALVVHQAASPDWQHFELPRILYLNTLVLVASSGTLDVARRRIARGTGLSWLSLTLVLGLLFVLGQVFAWQDLGAQGLFLATSPSSSFFYVFTALHGLHVLGGLAGLSYVLYRVSRMSGPAAQSAVGAAALYWHFMAALWLCLLAILALRI